MTEFGTHPVLEFIYIDAGGGHRSAATALCDVIASRFPGWHVKLVNLFQDILRPIDPVHRLTRARSEDIYNSILKSGRTYGFVTLMRVMRQMIKWHTPAIEDMLRQYWSRQQPRPDLVVSLIPHFNGVMFRALKQVHPQTPFVTVMTDLADCPPHFWQEKQDQFIICGSEKSLQQAKAAGYGPERIFRASGMILKPCFYQQDLSADRRQEREKLGLDPDTPTALIMFGGHGARIAEKIVTRLNRLNRHIQSIVMCGHNEKLHRKLQNKKYCHAVSFTADKVPHYMHLADFFIGKPGPGSISEALHMGLPVITERNHRTMPQERYNTVWLQEQQVGVVVKNFAQISVAVRSLLEDGHLELFRENARQLKNSAVHEIPDMLSQIMAAPWRAAA